MTTTPREITTDMLVSAVVAFCDAKGWRASYFFGRPDWQYLEAIAAILKAVGIKEWYPVMLVRVRHAVE